MFALSSKSNWFLSIWEQAAQKCAAGWYIRWLWHEITDPISLCLCRCRLENFSCTVVSWADSSGFGLLYGCGCLSYEQLVWLKASTNSVYCHPILPFLREHCQDEFIDSSRLFNCSPHYRELWWCKWVMEPDMKITNILSDQKEFMAMTFESLQSLQ